MLSIQEVGGQSLANYWERGMEVIYKKKCLQNKTARKALHAVKSLGKTRLSNYFDFQFFYILREQCLPIL